MISWQPEPAGIGGASTVDWLVQTAAFVVTVAGLADSTAYVGRHRQPQMGRSGRRWTVTGRDRGGADGAPPWPRGEHGSR